MQTFIMKLAEAGDSEGGASKTPPAVEPPVVVPAQAAGDSTDDFGYPVPAKTDASAEAVAEPEKKVAPPAAEEITDPATGYGKEPPKAPAAPPPPPPEEPKVDLGYELEDKEMTPAELTKVKEFAKVNALTKEAAQAFLNLRKSEQLAAVKAKEDNKIAYENAVASTKSSWYNELKTHAEFGGEHFEKNIQTAEKVLKQFLPDTKKALTERGSMLPPYVMRDLAKLGERLFAPEKLVQGDATVGEVVVEERHDEHLDFYT